MTSNIGSDLIMKMGKLGFDTNREETLSQKENLREKVMEALKENFRPEFLNRVDEIIIFNYLGKEEIKRIAELELGKVASRLKDRKIQLSFSEMAKEFLAEAGFDLNLGARPLKRVIQRKVLDPLSLKIVSGQIQEQDRILAEVENGEIIFKGSRDLLKVQPKNLKKVLIK